MMYHPRPQHPFPTRELHPNLYEAPRNQYSFSRSNTSNVRDLDSSSRTQVQAEDSEMMVEPPQHTYPPPSLAFSGNNEPSSTQYSPTSYEGFQSPPRTNQSRLPPQSPTFALRPARPNNIFSHIEHPAVSSENQVEPVSSDDEDRYQTQATTPRYSRRSVYTASQPQNSYSYPAAHEPEHQRPFVSHHQLQITNDTPQLDSSPYALTRLSAPVEPDVPIGTLRPVGIHRTRGRNGSDSSINSMLSNAAVVGDAIYRTDSIYNSISGRATRQMNAEFQSQPTSTGYLYESSSTDTGTAVNPQTPRGTEPAAPNFGSPYMPPTSPHYEDPHAEHPFVYQGVDWDFRLRGLRPAIATNTDADAMSVDQERRSSSRGSSNETSNDHLKRDRKISQNSQPPASISGDGKKKTAMACHFCRFRKLRCDGGSPCGHCEKRQQECTYDTTIRRRGPGRKNKSAQETARVQLAQRQREEADREAKGQIAKTKKQPHGSFVMVMPVEKRDVSMQTSPQTAQHPFSPQNRGYHMPSGKRMTATNQATASPSGRDAEVLDLSPPSLTSGNSLIFPRTEFHMRSPQSQETSPLPLTCQTFTALYEREQPNDPKTFPISLAHQQQNQFHDSDQDKGSTRGRLPSGLKTPVSTAPSSFYETSPDRLSASHDQRMGYYSPSSYESSLAYQSSRYQNDAQTDAESVYAYSEGANVTPARYGGHPYIPVAPRSDVQATYTREASLLLYPEESSSYAEANRVGRGWTKPLSQDTARR
ncbi:Fungal Zn(2)-Cys(6) binuclear cluster domain [Ceratobasidium sp. AG-Ba]|nr:Fungal Zn(2)-Cys(6) binuclear cluster domain [Ceratobasidium sp. AG-Ba]